MVDEEMKIEEIRRRKEVEKEMREHAVWRNQEQMNVLDRIYHLEKENLSMKKDFELVSAENLRMRQRLKQIESPFGTPQEPASQRHGVLEGEDEKEDEVSLSGFETPKDEKKIEEGGKKDLNEKSMELMLKMMDSMQKMMLKKNGSPEVEMVRGAHLEVSRLQEWSAESAPLDLGDWFIMLDPVG